MDNIRQLPRLLAFTTVAQQKSFTRASKLLGISKSAVSQQISQLESQMGVRLLNRTTRGLSLTALGEKMFERSLSLQDQVDQLFTEVEQAGATPKGRFAITYPHALQSTVVLPAIEQLCIEYPGLEPALIVDDASLDLVTNHLDVAIHVGELPDSSYRALPVGAITEIFCATQAYLDKHPPITSVQDLHQHRWIATSWQTATMQATHVDSGETEKLNLNITAQVNALPVAVDMALRHLGIVLLPDVLATPLIKSEELVHIACDVTGPRWPVYNVHAYQQDKPIHVTRFHQLITRFFDENNLAHQ